MYMVAAVLGAVAVWLAQRLVRPREGVWAERLINISQVRRDHDFIHVRIRTPRDDEDSVQVGTVGKNGGAPTYVKANADTWTWAP